MSSKIINDLVLQLLVFSSFFLLAATPVAIGRTTYTINDNWKFYAGEMTGAQQSGMADNAWETVTIPHTWNAKDAFDDEPGFRRGTGWYRRTLPLGPELKNQRIFLYFEGANQVADVYVNEKLAGRHIGGYTAFSFDVTDFVKFDKTNIIAVKVDNSFNEDIPPLTADFTFYGGIYRDVWLIAADEVHIKAIDMASSGVKITTPQVSAQRSTVNVATIIVNKSGRARSITVTNTIVDADGKDVISSSAVKNIPARGETNFEHLIKPAKAMKLWSPDDPYLYTVKTVVRDGDRIVDEISSPLGFRWFSFDGEKGFSLNGKPLKLRGTNRHQDYAGLGNAVPDSLHIRDMEIIKDAGFNFVRLAHYPQDPSVLQAADRLGLLIWEEIPLVNYITISNTFNENSAQMLKEMVRQHRNHPSVIMWGYMNEIFLRVPKENADNIRKATVELAHELDKISRTEDPTRPTTIAFHGNDLYNTMGMGEIPQVIGWNLYSGWYSGEFDGFGKFIDEQHKRFPARPLIISEYGANGDRRLHSSAPRRFDSTMEWQRMFHESYLAQINARPFIAGSAIWSQFDFGSEYRGETIPQTNQKGMLTIDRKPKDIHYFYKASFSTQPVLHIVARDWPDRAGQTGADKIDVYSNLPEVEFLLNGISLGKKKNNAGHKVSWDVNFRNGINTHSAQGVKNGERTVDTAQINFTLVNVQSDQIAINAGSNAQFVDESKTVWLADQAYQKGNWGFIGANAKAVYSGTNDKNVSGTLEDPLFQTMQEDLSGYRFDVANGLYEVELRFTETKFEKAGERVFDVAINGAILMENFDPVKDAGYYRPVIRRFIIKAINGIEITFTPRKGLPILSAVKLMRIR